MPADPGPALVYCLTRDRELAGALDARVGSALVFFYNDAARLHQAIVLRVTEFSVTEEAFDPRLNPIRAKVSLGLRVLSVDDLGFSHRGGGLFMTYLRTKEALAQSAPSTPLAALGLQGLP